MMWWWGDGHMGTGGWIGMGFMILFWIAVLVGIFYLVRYLVARPSSERPYQGPPPHYQATGLQGPAQGKSEALKILEERYARGEIDQEEFLKRRADLS